MRYFPKLSGERVYLSPISLEDAESYTKWLNDLWTTRYLTLSAVQMTLQGEREALADISRGHSYAIVARDGDELLGNCGLMNVDGVNRRAEVGIFIGEESKRGKGYGTEALGLLCDYAFNIVNLRSLMLETYDYNERGMASYRKAGFKEMGRRRKAHFYGGDYHDIVLMDMLAEEFGLSSIPGPREAH